MNIQDDVEELKAMAETSTIIRLLETKLEFLTEGPNVHMIVWDCDFTPVDIDSFTRKEFYFFSERIRNLSLFMEMNENTDLRRFPKEKQNWDTKTS